MTILFTLLIVFLYWLVGFSSFVLYITEEEDIPANQLPAISLVSFLWPIFFIVVVQNFLDTKLDDRVIFKKRNNKEK